MAFGIPPRIPRIDGNAGTASLMMQPGTIPEEVPLEARRRAVPHAAALHAGGTRRKLTGP